MLISAEYDKFIYWGVFSLFMVALLIFYKKNEEFNSFPTFLRCMFASALISGIFGFSLVSIVFNGVLSECCIISDLHKENRYHVLFYFKSPRGKKIKTWGNERFIYNDTPYYYKIMHINYSIGGYGEQDNYITHTICPQELYMIPDSIEDLQYWEPKKEVREPRYHSTKHYLLK